MSDPLWDCGSFIEVAAFDVVELEVKQEFKSLAMLLNDSVAKEIAAPIFERAGPRFKSHSGRSRGRRTDYPFAGSFKSQKPEMAGPRPLEVVEPHKKKKVILNHHQSIDKQYGRTSTK
uniref:Uncharacterized protein n=1 Tax=Anopheles culicifacies TaxID=139723 RepID=A0A182LX09_9DIPT